MEKLLSMVSVDDTLAHYLAHLFIFFSTTAIKFRSMDMTAFDRLICKARHEGKCRISQKKNDKIKFKVRYLMQVLPP